MSDESMQSGQVSSTPEGGPVAAGAPTTEPGAGQVYSTPEAAPLGEGQDQELVPPTWREHMDGPVLGMDDISPAAASSSASAREEPQATAETRTPTPLSTSTREDISRHEPDPARSAAADEELRKWPPHSGKPVSEVRWDALRYAAPVVAQAEKLGIKAIDLTGRGLSKLAHYLETRRQERENQSDR